MWKKEVTRKRKMDVEGNVEKGGRMSRNEAG